MDHDEYWHYEGEEGHAIRKKDCKICRDREGRDFSLTTFDNRPKKKSFWHW